MAVSIVRDDWAALIGRCEIQIFTKSSLCTGAIGIVWVLDEKFRVD